MPRRSPEAGWIYKRWLKLTPNASTADVSKVLKIKEQLLRTWATNAEFQSAEIATKIGNSLYWNREKLLLWILAINGIPDYIRRQYELLEPDDARSRLGIERAIVLNPRKKK